jgi:DNA polymerase-3 subunit epsilon
LREIVLDTETTGLDATTGDRVVEIACLELENRIPTGNHFQRYVNPERDMPEGAFRIHGLSAEFLSGHPVFAKLVDDFLAFIAGDPLVIHNAEFDLRFLNAELKRLDRSALANRAIDTVALARRKFPGAQVNLDALCRRFEIDNSARTFHGALLDCELLAEVYLELSGGRQPGFDLASAGRAKASQGPAVRQARSPRPHEPSAEERAAHEAYLNTFEEPIWRN